MSARVVHDTAAGRFQIEEGGRLAVLDYSLAGGTITFVHTGVPPELEGRGIGSKLARAGLDYARREALSVVPQCPFVLAYVHRHKEYADLLA